MLISLCLQFIFTFFTVFIYFKYLNTYLLDFPNTNIKNHLLPTPYLGGIILIVNIMIICLCFYYLNNPLIVDNNLIIKHLNSKSFYLIFFVFTILLILIGLYDDTYGLNFAIRLFLTGAIFYFAVVIYSDLQIIKLDFNLFNEINIYSISVPFTILCFLTLINSLNFYDGVNGQSSIYIFFIFSYLYIETRFPVLICLLVPLIFFMLLNIKGKAFMGDSGIYGYSYLIGLFFVLAYNNSLINIEEIILLTLLPFIDLLRLCYSRIVRGHSPFLGDKYHLHHLINYKSSLLYTNIILLLLLSLPIVLFKFFNSFFINIFMYICIYLIVIKRYKSKNKND